MKSVFLVKSPLQLLNAVEAKHYYKIRTSDCVLIIMGDRKSQPQLFSLARDMREWGSVLILDRLSLFSRDSLNHENLLLSENMSATARFFSKSLFNVRRLNRISKMLQQVECLFVGYIRSVYMRHFINILSHKKLLLLDDGHATIQLAKERRLGLHRLPPQKLKQRLKLYAKRYLQGLKDQHAYSRPSLPPIPDEACHLFQ